MAAAAFGTGRTGCRRTQRMGLCMGAGVPCAWTSTVHAHELHAIGLHGVANVHQHGYHALAEDAQITATIRGAPTCGGLLPEDTFFTLLKPVFDFRRTPPYQPQPCRHSTCHAAAATLHDEPSPACLQVPPLGKGSLYLRPLLLGTGPILGLGPAPSYTFTVYAAAVGAYFKVSS